MSCKLSCHPKHLHYVTPCAGRWATKNSDSIRSACCCAGNLAGSAAAPNTCTMSHHVQDGGQQAAAAGHQECHAGPASTPIVPVRYAGCPNKCTMSHHMQESGQKKRLPSPKPPGSRHVKCACGIRKTICKRCNGGSICTHGIQRQWCMRAECGGGAARCQHGTQRSKCLRCGGTGVCKHGKVRCRCLDCKQEEQNAQQQ